MVRRSKTITFYDALADSYDDLSIDVGYTLAGSTYDWMKPHLPADPGNLLDIGIGTGLVSEPFAADEWTVTGIDGSPTMLAQVARKGIAQHLIEADLSGGEIPLDKERFDAIACIGVFEFVRTERLFFDNIARLCNPGALFALAIRDPDLNPQFTRMELHGQDIDRVAYERDGVIAVHHRWTDVLAALEGAGFELVAEKQVVAYRSPTQGFDTINRLVLLRHIDTTDALRDTHDRLLAAWGFEGHAFARAPRIMLLEAALVGQLTKDLRVLSAAITRLAPGGRLTIGSAADRFTHCVGQSPSAVPTPFIARPDLVLRNGQPKILELNVDSSLGGTVEVSTLADAYTRSGYFDAAIRFRSPLDALADLLGQVCRAAAGRSNRARLLILTSRHFRDYDRDNADAMARHIAARAALDCAVGYLDEVAVAHKVLHHGKAVDALLKLDVIIDDAETSAFADFLNLAGASGTAIVSDNRYVNVEDKAAIALLRHLTEQHSPILSAAEKAVITRTTVPTWLLSMPAPEPALDWLAWLDREREWLVLKRCFSFGGSSVIRGAACSRDRWLEHCAAALDDPALWVVQEYVDGDALIFGDDGYGRAVAGASVREDRGCVISPFVYGKQIGGFLCRVSRTPDNPVVGLASGSRTAFYLIGEWEPGQ